MTKEEWLEHWLAKAPPLSKEQVDKILDLMDQRAD